MRNHGFSYIFMSSQLFGELWEGDGAPPKIMCSPCANQRMKNSPPSLGPRHSHSSAAVFADPTNAQPARPFVQLGRRLHRPHRLRIPLFSTGRVFLGTHARVVRSRRRGPRRPPPTTSSPASASPRAPRGQRSMPLIQSKREKSM